MILGSCCANNYINFHVHKKKLEMKILEKIVLSTEKYNGLAIVIAAAAFLLSLLSFLLLLLSVFSNGMPNIAKPYAATVSWPEKIWLRQNLGVFSFNTTVSLLNDGGSDVNLKDASFSIELENGQFIKLVADAYQKTSDVTNSGSYFELPLSDVVIKPGASWSGSITFRENQQREQREAIENLNNSLIKEARRKSTRQAAEMVSLIGKYLAPDKQLIISNPEIQSLFNRCENASKELSDQALKITNSGLIRLAKGLHATKFQLNTLDKKLPLRIKQLVIDERQILQLNDPDYLVSQVCSNPNGYSNIQTPNTNIELLLTELKK